MIRLLRSDLRIRLSGNPDKNTWVLSREIGPLQEQTESVTSSRPVKDGTSGNCWVGATKRAGQRGDLIAVAGSRQRNCRVRKSMDDFSHSVVPGCCILSSADLEETVAQAL